MCSQRVHMYLQLRKRAGALLMACAVRLDVEENCRISWFTRFFLGLLLLCGYCKLTELLLNLEFVEITYNLPWQT